MDYVPHLRVGRIVGMAEESVILEVKGPSCGGCGRTMVKSGRRPSGKQRWVCKGCGRYTDFGEAVEVGRSAVELARDPVLMAYRHVLANPVKYDVSGLEKLARRNHDESPQEFEKRYRELEAQERGGVVGSDGAVSDESEDRVLALIDSFLGALSAQSGEVLPEGADGSA